CTFTWTSDQLNASLPIEIFVGIGNILISRSNYFIQFRNCLSTIRKCSNTLCATNLVNLINTSNITGSKYNIRYAFNLWWSNGDDIFNTSNFSKCYSH